MDELSALTKYNGDYRRCNLFCLTEIWLKEDVSDMTLPGYTTIRLYPDSENPETARRWSVHAGEQQMGNELYSARNCQH